jgi:hypothetical protein
MPSWICSSCSWRCPRWAAAPTCATSVSGSVSPGCCWAPRMCPPAAQRSCASSTTSCCCRTRSAAWTERPHPPSACAGGARSAAALGVGAYRVLGAQACGQEGGQGAEAAAQGAVRTARSACETCRARIPLCLADAAGPVFSRARLQGGCGRRAQSRLPAARRLPAAAEAQQRLRHPQEGAPRACGAAAAAATGAACGCGRAARAQVHVSSRLRAAPGCAHLQQAGRVWRGCSQRVGRSHGVPAGCGGPLPHGRRRSRRAGVRVRARGCRAGDALRWHHVCALPPRGAGVCARPRGAADDARGASSGGLVCASACGAGDAHERL